MADSAVNMERGLPGLSVEILLQIMTLLERSDKKSLRLMNRRIRDVASEKMFKSISVGFELTALRQLENVSKSPYWAAQVQSLEWIAPAWDFDVGGGPDFERLNNYLQQLPSVTSVWFSECNLYYVPGYLRFFRPLAEIMLSCVRPLTLEIDNVTTLFKNGNTKDVSIRGAEHAFTAFRLPHLPQLVLLMLQNEESALVKLSISGVMVHASEFELFDTTYLQALSLRTVILIPSEEEDPLESFLSELRHGVLLCPERPIDITLTDVGKHGYIGTMDATSEEVTTWINGNGDTWLATKQALYTQYQESTEQEEHYEDWDQSFHNPYDTSDDESGEDWKVVEQRRRKGQMSYFR